jgi:tRNA(Ile)-lysidine synthase
MDRVIQALSGLRPQARYLVGVSGGLDSMCLLHALHAGGFRKLTVCHLNHDLRARASEADARFVRRWAEKWGFDCVVEKQPVAQLAAASGESIEAAARRARYDFFQRTARSLRCPRLILAHHADDQAETVLANILRGTGLSGVSGMKVQSQQGKLTLLRPWLTLRRDVIQAYALENRVPWREDASNLSLEHTRNRLRHVAIPGLNDAMQRDIVPALLRLANTAQREDDWMTNETQSLLAQMAGPEGALLLTDAFKLMHPALQHRVVRAWLLHNQVPEVHADTVAQAVGLLHHTNPARVNLAQDLQVRRKAKTLKVTRQGA